MLSLSKDKHCVAQAVEPIILFDRFVIRIENSFSAAEGAD